MLTDPVWKAIAFPLISAVFVAVWRSVLLCLTRIPVNPADLPIILCASGVGLYVPMLALDLPGSVLSRLTGADVPLLEIALILSVLVAMLTVYCIRTQQWAHRQYTIRRLFGLLLCGVIWTAALVVSIVVAATPVALALLRA